MRFEKLRNKIVTMLWIPEIKKFKRADNKSFPSKNSILFTGSSTIRMWETLEEDMAPLRVINRGFGGARIIDVLHYYKKVVLPYHPKGIVFYCGENDIAGLLKSKSLIQEYITIFRRLEIQI